MAEVLRKRREEEEKTSKSMGQPACDAAQKSEVDMGKAVADKNKLNENNLIGRVKWEGQWWIKGTIGYKRQEEQYLYHCKWTRIVA